MTIEIVTPSGTSNINLELLDAIRIHVDEEDVNAKSIDIEVIMPQEKVMMDHAVVQVLNASDEVITETQIN